MRCVANAEYVLPGLVLVLRVEAVNHILKRSSLPTRRRCNAFGLIGGTRRTYFARREGVPQSRQPSLAAQIYPTFLCIGDDHHLRSKLRGSLYQRLCLQG